jgi:imidazolonepropionase-like amidohydrolase
MIRRCSFRWLLLALLLVAPALQAQPVEGLAPVTRTFALTNARIVQAPGRVIERGTVVVRNGLIQAVGPNVPIPFDARPIAADSLVVYAGFIDGLSNAGIPKPKQEENLPRVPQPGNPPNDRAGIQPERQAHTLLKPDDNSVEALRKAGFTLTHTVPYGRMLPGSGALIFTAGATPDAMLLRPSAALFAQLTGAQGVYPNTTIGVMAKFRQLYREAAGRRQHETLYAAQGAGLERPVYDAVHHAFFPVLAGTQPVLFLAETALDLHRALRLQQDLGFPMMLAGLNEGFERIDALRAANLPLFVTLQLPKEPKTEAKDSTLTYNPGFRTQGHQDVEAERKNLALRQQQAWKQQAANAATLHQAGLRFGFATMGTKPDEVHKNLRTMIQHGLPEDVALAALTTTPAALLGLEDRLGTVEVGKIANLVVTTGPYFEEKSQIRYVFVDGHLFTYEVKKASEKARSDSTAAPVNPVGTWDYTVTTPDGEGNGTLTLTGTPDNLAGSLTLDVLPGPATLENLSFDDNTLSFTFDAGQPGQVKASISFNADTFSGTFEVSGMGGVPVSGTRTSGPDF